MSQVDITGLIAGHFPLGQIPVQLQVADPYPTSESSGEPVAVATVRLIVWDVDGDQPSIRDIKEQQLYMGWPSWYRDAERVAAFFAALGAIIAEIPLEAIDRLMPHDLMPTDAFKLKRARSRDDFDAALRAKSRLGQYLP